MNDLSQKTGIAVYVVRDIVYDAIAKGQFTGKMKGEFFVRGRPVSTSYEPTTREREIV